MAHPFALNFGRVGRTFYIILLAVSFCRLAAMAAPVLQPYCDLSFALHNDECSHEDVEHEKSGAENKEESAPAQFTLSGYPDELREFNSISDHRTLEYRARPVCPPPNAA